MRLTHIATAIIMCCALEYSSAGTVTLSDGTFNDTAWDVVTNPAVYGYSTATQFPLGGSPGMFREIRTVSTATNGFQVYDVTGWHFNTAQVYDPADGEILSLDYSEDALFIQGTQRLYGRIAIRQDGFLYRSKAEYLSGFSDSQWRHFELTGLTASDFEVFFNGIFLPTGNPDFSETGSPIEFGVYRELFDGSNARDIRMGLDNWQVVLTTTGIPEPTSVVLAATGALLALRRRS
ncbi:hypothetical protein [Botrimarina mediterranea]|uniref:PEP-CTERM protein-sorting domain-containing protein n=1 Tax=Botrimarina mediterranea TaxID=2528022 RepID=A0A518K603_9BACT|nr:hypothetical protein [Botrimarina mediterranea]QDV73207.1 hypothetical protein Spa11_14030 [Botrimarina mediterranea]